MNEPEEPLCHFQESVSEGQQ